MTQITSQEIRKVILTFLDERLMENKDYKVAQTKLDNALAAGDKSASHQYQQTITELKNRYTFENWICDALTRRIFWIDIGTHLAKGINSSSSASNINYQIQDKSNDQSYVSSDVVSSLPLDCTGNAAGLDIFALLNKEVTSGISLLNLIAADHPSMQLALSDDKQQGAIYFANLKNLITNEVENPKSSELNKQIFWPNHTAPYLSHKMDDYRLLTPLYPSSLTQIVYQKVQSRFSDDNKAAMELKRKHGAPLKPYFTFQELAVVKLGGNNPQGVSQFMSRQGGRNFLLPSMPPKFTSARFPSLSKQQESFFSPSLRFYCRAGFRLLFNVVNAEKNNAQERRHRKDALDIILASQLRLARHIQTTMPAGWSLDYNNLKMHEKYWLDPHRAELENETQFKCAYLSGEWIKALENDFAIWVQAILKNKFKQKTAYFSDSEHHEWQKAFRHAIKANLRKQQGGL